jgi:sugar/nucleoside kinase (ribokinase family)
MLVAVCHMCVVLHSEVLHYHRLQRLGASYPSLDLIAAIGELLLDVTVAPRGLLRPGDDQDAHIRLGGGGQAANFCAWAASLGERSRLITRVGDDAAGRLLLAELSASGVEVLAARSSEPTGVVIVLVEAGGERTFARQRGASTGLRAGDLSDSWLAGLRLLHVPAYSLFWEPLASAARRAVELVRGRAGLISVDLSSAVGLREYGGANMAEDLLRLAPDLLFATEDELAEVTLPPRRLARLVVVKLGARGCRVLGRRVPAPLVDEVDTTGAGDAFAAAFCAAYVEGSTPLEAAGRAVLVAGRAVGQLGARP